jgi:hypothetical protein
MQIARGMPFFFRRMENKMCCDSSAFFLHWVCRKWKGKRIFFFQNANICAKMKEIMENEGDIYVASISAGKIRKRENGNVLK